MHAPHDGAACRSLEELLLLADGPGGVPAGNDGTFGGNADEESALMVTRAVRHHIRKDLKRTVCNFCFSWLFFFTAETRGHDSRWILYCSDSFLFKR